ncbi:hypothetical protein D3C87_1284100 [compost metagenome]
MVAQIICQIDIDGPPADLASIVFQCTANNLDLAFGIDTATAVIELRATRVEQNVTGIGGDSSTLCVDASQRLQVQAIAFDLSAQAIA